jgi:hypothetical protein
MHRSLATLVIASGLAAACSSVPVYESQSLPPHGTQRSDCAQAQPEVSKVDPGPPIQRRQPAAPRSGPAQGFACFQTVLVVD